MLLLLESGLEGGLKTRLVSGQRVTFGSGGLGSGECLSEGGGLRGQGGGVVELRNAGLSRGAAAALRRLFAKGRELSQLLAEPLNIGHVLALLLG